MQTQEKLKLWKVSGIWVDGDSSSIVAFLTVTEYNEWKDRWFGGILPDGLTVESVDLDTPLYVGSLWHQDCDPFVSVIATTKEKAENVLDELAEEEYKEMQGSADEGEEVTDDIMTGGVFAEYRLDDFLPPNPEPDKLGDLLSQGYCIL